MYSLSSFGECKFIIVTSFHGPLNPHEIKCLNDIFFFKISVTELLAPVFGFCEFYKDSLGNSVCFHWKLCDSKLLWQVRKLQNANDGVPIIMFYIYSIN